MEIGSPQWSRLIREGAAARGVALWPEQLALFARHAEELLRWNAVSNLTALTRAEDIARQHFLDSLAAAPLVPPGSALLDVGSGGGFPGLPLHIAVPGLRTLLVDAVRKKVSFLRHAVRALALERVEALHARAEDLAADPGHVRRYDVVVARAVPALPAFIRAALPLLKPGGRLIALKGRPSAAELAAVRGAIGGGLALGLERYTLPGLRNERTLLVIGAGAGAGGSG